VGNVLVGKIVDMKVMQTIRLIGCCLIIGHAAANFCCGIQCSQCGNGEPRTSDSKVTVFFSFKSCARVRSWGTMDDLNSWSPMIDQSHDIDLIIKTILGATYWSQLDKEAAKSDC
jgi:phospholipid transport system substrate-binding protein